MNYLTKLEILDKQTSIKASELSGIDKFLSGPLTEEEKSQLEELKLHVKELDYESWVIPEIELPDDYKKLLQYSNGGLITNGERELGFFGHKELRDYFIRYSFVEFLPGAIPIGFNGGGIFYAYDLRSKDRTPIIAVDSCNMNWEDTVILGDSIEEILSVSTNISDDLFIISQQEQNEMDKLAEAHEFNKNLKVQIELAAQKYREQNFKLVVKILSEIEEYIDPKSATKLKISKRKLNVNT